MTTFIETLLSSLSTGLVTFLITFHILRIKERKKLKDGYDHIEKMLFNMYRALCNLNGMGEKFEAEYKTIVAAEKEIQKNERG